MKDKEKKTEYGTLKINNEVIVSIARNAALEVDGVLAIKSNPLTILSDFFQRGFNNQGINLDIQDGEVKISLNIVVRYGVTIPDVATSVQDNIRGAIERFTGLNVSEVNVSVAGLQNEKGEELLTQGGDDAHV